MARTLIVRTHFDSTTHKPTHAIIHAEQCTDLATTDDNDIAFTTPIPGESVTVRDINNEYILRDIAYPLKAHKSCLQALDDAEAADLETAQTSPTTHELAAQVGVPEVNVTRAAESWVRLHGSGTAFFPTLRDDAFVVRPAFEAYVRDLLTNGSLTETASAVKKPRRTT